MSPVAVILPFRFQPPPIPVNETLWRETLSEELDTMVRPVVVEVNSTVDDAGTNVELA